MMVNEIRGAIAQRLDELIPGVEIHIDELLQGFEEPCFFVLTLNSSQQQIVGDRYYRRHAFDIQYFPKNTEAPAAEIGEVEAALWLALEYIELADGPIRGVEQNAKSIDGVLHFFVNYDVFMMRKRDPLPYMQVLKQIQTLKGG